VPPARKLGFREIADELRTAIISGRYPTGSVLPPEPQLAAEYGASRSLVNRAMQNLAAEGLVRARQGRGTVVTWLPPMLHSPARYSREFRERNSARGAFGAEVRALGLEPQHEIETEHADPPLTVAEILGVSSGEKSCLVRRRRLLASGIPVRLNATWIPLDIARGTALEDANAVLVGGVKTTLADLGHPQVAAWEWIVPSRLPTAEEVDALEISPDRTVVDIIHVGTTADGRAVEVTTTVAPAHYVLIKTEFPLT
jgi:GntR family transcriptional regulator